MSRAKRNGEMAFGSDSFLDVIANMVGIMVILIVLVGLRIKTAPARPETAAAVADQQRQRDEWERRRLEIDAENTRRRQHHDETEAADRDRQAQYLRQLADREAVIEQRLSQQRQNERLQRHIDEQAEAQIEEVERLQQQIESAARQQQDHDQRRRRWSQEMARVDRDLADLQQQRRQRQAEIEQGRRRQGQLDEAAKELEEQARNVPPAPVQEWRHFLTPVSRTADLPELHFRCLKERIAATHLQELLDRLKRQAQMRELSGVASGTVGPIAGFQLQYLLSAQRHSLTDHVMHPFSVRIELLHAELQADSDELGESAEQAFASGSAIRQSLAAHPPTEHSITLWVYEDSFILAKAIQTELHRLGYAVAQRPLPMGAPISIGPNGSASRTR